MFMAEIIIASYAKNLKKTICNFYNYFSLLLTKVQVNTCRWFAVNALHIVFQQVHCYCLFVTKPFEGEVALGDTEIKVCWNPAM